MKKIIITCLLCVVFSLTLLNTKQTFANFDETLEFVYNSRIFTYSLSKNIKTSSQFDLNYEINKYNRFSSLEERQQLLQTMLKAGIEKSIALNYIFPNLTKKIKLIEKSINISPKNATININTNSEKVFHINPEVTGIHLDTDSLYSNIVDSYLSNKNLSFNLPTITIHPQISKQDLEAHTHLRADFSTSIASSSQDRKHNIKNALASLNKIEIYPNQIFSFNKTVGRRTAENGYRQAKIIINNEFVDGIGGGVCQVSSTLYNSALLAGLEILEANKHSRQVSYVTAGFDAMVNFGSSDLKFKNNTNEKITIITNFSQSTARIRIFGSALNNTKYKIRNEIFNIQEPTEEILIDETNKYKDKVKYSDEYFILKAASKGMEIKSYRETWQNNKIVHTELLRHDKYRTQNAIKVYGTQPREEKSTDQLCA